LIPFGKKLKRRQNRGRQNLLLSGELQIELQDSGSESSFYVDVYDFAVTKDLSSLGLAIIPEPTTLLLTILALAAMPLRMRRG